jgi:hypothetical protein
LIALDSGLIPLDFGLIGKGGGGGIQRKDECRSRGSGFLASWQLRAVEKHGTRMSREPADSKVCATYAPISDDAMSFISAIKTQNGKG